MGPFWEPILDPLGPNMSLKQVFFNGVGGVHRIHRDTPRTLPPKPHTRLATVPHEDTPRSRHKHQSPKTRPCEKPDNHPQNDPSTRDILKILLVEATEVLRLTA